MNQYLIQDSKLIVAYKELREQYNKLRDAETLRKYIILSKAQAIARKLYNRAYTVRRLSIDFEIPYTTVKRCLSLERANKRTWGLIRDKKISAFKVAQALSTKSRHFQDEIIDIIIKNKLSTYDIKTLRISQHKDIRIAKQKLAIKKGYSRQSSAYDALNRSIERLSDFMTIDISLLPTNKLKLIKSKLNKLSLSINEFNNKIK